MNTWNKVWMIVVGIVVVAGLARADVVLYQDSFTGTGELNGRAPELARDAFGNASTATWVANPGYYTLNGTQAALLSSGGSNQNAFLPFMPTSGHVYTFSADLTPLTGASTGHWLAMAYDSEFSSDRSLVGFSDTGVTWTTIAGNAAVCTGPGWTADATDPAATGVTYPKRFSQILDTTNPTDWKFTWKMSDPDGSNSVVLRAATAFGGVPTITGVTFGPSSALYTGTVDNVSLMVDSYSIPEPSALTLLGTGLIGLLAYAWRRCK
jgi:hypothetical protein